MAGSTESRSAHHALLVGIDGYEKKPLRGCVRDIDDVHALLLRMKVPAQRIRRLASPGASAARFPGEPATLANIRARLAELASDEVQPGDRVFIYYSGHGGRTPVRGKDGRTFHREALAPVDVHESRFLFDHEVNQAIAKIAARTRALTLILDCCYSAGATRTAGSSLVSRCLDTKADLGWSAPLQEQTDGEVDQNGLAHGVDDCLVVAACLNHELAYEDGAGGGLLTRALLDALEGVTDDELPHVRWSKIWQSVRAGVIDRHAWQHPWMGGNAARQVFGGPPLEGDAGFALTRSGSRSYTIDAGTLARVSTGALIAVYGDRPAVFPALDSDLDRAARHGVLVVTGATRSSAAATAQAGDFALPHGARGRLIAPGEPDRLPCAVLVRGDRARSDDQAIALLKEKLRASPLLEVVDSQEQATVRLERSAGTWFVTDALHDAAPDRALVSLGERDLPCARALLEHYVRYAMPFRWYELARDLPDGLELDVLACPGEVAPTRAQDPGLVEAPSLGESTYQVASGSGVCFRVRNTSGETLRALLLNSAASGKVQILGDQVIDGKSGHIFWALNVLGRPFTMRPPDGMKRCIDRLTVIGTTAVDTDLAHLRVEGTFADILRRWRAASTSGMRDGLSARDADEREPSDLPVERWTAAHAVIRTVDA